MSKKNFYVLDTSSLITNAECLFSFGINDLIIPFSVLEELDNNKNSSETKGYNVRTAIRNIENILKNKKSQDGGYRISKNKGLLYFSDIEKHEQTVDNIIIKTAQEYKRNFSNKKIFIVSDDINLKIKAKVSEINSISTPTSEKNKFQIYSGKSQLTVPDEQIDKLYLDKSIDIELKLNPNECIILCSELDRKKTCLGIYKEGKINVLKEFQKKSKKINYLDEFNFNSFRWIEPKNKEQRFCMELLNDEKIPLVTMIGAAGTGKTLTAISCGLRQTLETQKYKKLIVSRPIQPLGKDIGYLPGSAKEKLEPWIRPIKDNLEVMLNDRMFIEDIFNENLIEIEPLTYIRGRSLSNSFVIIDEAQNLSKHEIKTIVTRIGKNSKIVFTGDVEQIDNPKINEETNGLTYLVNKFKDQKLSGHITLIKSERSELADVATKIL